jgi:hypothetical protein
MPNFCGEVSWGYDIVGGRVHIFGFYCMFIKKVLSKFFGRISTFSTPTLVHTGMCSLKANTGS